MSSSLLEHNYNGRSRHQLSDERENVMEMTKLVPNQDRRDKHVTGSGVKSRATTETLNLSLHQYARNGDEHNMKNLLRPLGSHSRKKINQHDDELLTPLHYAARYNRLNLVKILVEAGADVQALGKDDTTPLHLAAGFRGEKKRMRQISSDEDMGASDLPALANHSEQERTGSVVSYLVSKGANINAVDVYNQTPLHFAARRGNEVTCRDLLSFKNRVKVEACDQQGITPLHIAATRGHVEVARLLIEADANLMCRDKEMSTPLHHAAREGNLQLIQVLFEACVKCRKPWLIHEMVNTIDVESSTPLHVAVENGHYDVAKLLVQKQSEVNRPREHSMYPLHLAAHSVDARIAQLLVDSHAHIDAVNEDLSTSLHIASMLNNIDVATFLVERGACINQRDQDNYSPLLLATCYNNVLMVELLLLKGADYTATDKYDKTAVFIAAEENNLQVLSKLLSYPQVKRLINESDYCDNEPLHVAARKGYLKIVQCLLENGASLDSKNEEERTPLHLASLNGRTNIVRELIKHNKNLVNSEDENSNTSLHLAAENGNSQVVRVLLDLGADVYARNYDQRTPLDLAASRGWTRTCQVLLERHTFVNLTDKSKTSPLHLASQNGHAHVVDLLLKSGCDVTLRDDIGRNCLDRAIDANQTAVAMVIVSSATWKEALRNVTSSPGTSHIETPMRKLIRKMPDVAQKVFNKCTSIKHEQNPERLDYEITFDYEFLEDVYASWIQEGLKSSTVDKRTDNMSSSGSLYTGQTEGRLPPSAEPYSRDSNVLKENHPLFIMILSERESLLAHPLVTTLLQHKWNTFGRFFYYLSFFIYIIFLIFLTAYMVTTDPPFLYGPDSTLIEDNQCGNLTKQYEQPLCASIGTYVIIALAGFNLLKELFQIYQAKLKYFGWTNIIEWTVYVTSLLLVISFNECQRITGYRFVWQWNLGAVSVFLVWFNLVLFIQKFPKFGIYVVMFTDILRTFSQFFVVFSLFIVAYAMAFYAVFQNKVSFSSIPRSLIKTYVMMVGEFEFDNIFNEREPDSVMYPEASYILFVIFVTSMSILIMNLLVGLAVDDIKTVQEQAALKRMAMQVELALDVERIIPEFIRRKAVCQKKTIFPNKFSQNPIWQILSDSYLSSKEIQKALNPKLDEMEILRTGQDRLSADMKKFKRSIKGVREQSQKLESMLKAVIAAQNITWEEEDYGEKEDGDDSEMDVQKQVDEML